MAHIATNMISATRAQFSADSHSRLSETHGHLFGKHEQRHPVAAAARVMAQHRQRQQQQQRRARETGQAHEDHEPSTAQKAQEALSKRAKVESHNARIASLNVNNSVPAVETVKEPSSELAAE
jgi:sRNA-binding protein